MAGQLGGMNSVFFRTAAALCFLAVGLGAFGAHALKETLLANGMSEVWNKAVLYHFVHALALLVLAVLPAASRAASTLFVAGIVLFSGSLYLLAWTNLKWLGPITPLGGSASWPVGRVSQSGPRAKARLVARHPDCYASSRICLA